MNQVNLFESLYETYKIKKPIRLIELFAGYGSQALALEYLGVNFEHYKIAEWNYKSCIAYKALHFPNDITDYSKGMNKEDLLNYLKPLGLSANWNEPMNYKSLSMKRDSELREIYNAIKATHNLVDISKVNAKDLEIENERERENEYMMTYSFPCFTANQLVLTKEKGYIPFIELKEDMNVLSHDKQYHKISKFISQGEKQTICINSMQGIDIHCTENHKFYVREMYRKGYTQKRYFKDPQWVEAKDLNKNYYLGNAVIIEEQSYYTDSLDFWYIVGAYLGDGWVNKTTKDVIICGNESKMQKLKLHYDNLNIKYTINQDSKHCFRLRTQNKDLKEFVLNNIGVGSFTKHISYEIMALPKTQLESFFNGYLNSDGSKISKNYSFTTINKNIVASMVAIINKLFHTPCKVYKCNTKPTHIIQGRKVNRHTQYIFRFKKEMCKQDKAFYENGYIWFPFRKAEQGSVEKVYDIEVENSHSFVLSNCIVHNCQDLSLAGTKQGMSKGNNTRSGLLWQVERILRELTKLKQRPNILLMENVPQVHGERNINDFKKWLFALSEMGYTSYYTDLIATDYGIPQTRDRCFMISILGDYYYQFPQPTPLKLKLKDMLETNVDNKYYLTPKMFNYMINGNVENYNRKQVFERNFTRAKSGIAATISTRAGERATDNFIFNVKRLNQTIAKNNDIEENDFIDAYNHTIIKNNAPTITCRVSAGNDKFVKQTLNIKNANSKGYLEAKEGDGIDISKRMKYHRGTVQTDKAQTLKTQQDVGVVVNKYDNLSIRKLTPRECFRLMGVKDEDFNKIKDKFSDSTLYHLAGDSIVVNVLMAIFKQLF